MKSGVYLKCSTGQLDLLSHTSVADSGKVKMIILTGPVIKYFKKWPHR